MTRQVKNSLFVSEASSIVIPAFASVGCLLAALSLQAAAQPAAPAPADILVVADVTAAGKAQPQPSEDRPIYYEPAWVGFRELGAVVAGEKPPPLEAAKKSLTQALRKSGYFPAGPGTPSPTVIIFFAWGTLNPDVVTTPGGDQDGQDESTSFNSAQMLGFLGAHKVEKLSDYAAERERVLSAAREDQYFLAVAAYDRESLYQHQRKLLWMTRIATDALRVWLPNVLPAMVAGGAPFFGRESKLPVWIDPGDRYHTGVRLAPLQIEGPLPENEGKPDPKKP